MANAVWKSRIVGYADVDPSQLVPSGLNFRLVIPEGPNEYGMKLVNLKEHAMAAD